MALRSAPLGADGLVDGVVATGLSQGGRLGVGGDALDDGLLAQGFLEAWGHGLFQHLLVDEGEAFRRGSPFVLRLVEGLLGLALGGVGVEFAVVLIRFLLLAQFRGACHAVPLGLLLLRRGALLLLSLEVFADADRLVVDLDHVADDDLLAYFRLLSIHRDPSAPDELVRLPA